MSRRRRGARPERIFGPVSGTVFLLLAWEAVAHASGSAWVQGIGTVVAGIAAVGLFGPRWAVRRVQLKVVDGPTDATVGQPVVVTVSANRSCRCTPSRPGGPSVVTAPGETTELRLEPHRRGTLTRIELRISSASPFGLLWWTQLRLVELPRPLVISPAPDPGSARLRQTGDDDATPGPDERGRVAPRPVASAPLERGEIRSIREYRRGDSPRTVHWRASAHTGALMVRESERDEEPPVRVVADLPDDADAAEPQASSVLGRIVALLDDRRRVVLETSESGRAVSGEVADQLDAGRRLARASRNPWGELGP